MLGRFTAGECTFSPVHVGYALLTLFPGRVGGSETNARGLLPQFAAGNGPERLTVLANRHVMAAYEELAGGPVQLHHVRSYRAGDSMPTRAIAMAWARAAPRRAARDVPADIDVMHYPVTVPIPATGAPRVVTLFDLQHHDLPHLFSRGERAFRRWAYDDAARTADTVVTTSEFTKGRVTEVLGVDPGRIEVVYMGLHKRFSPEPGDDARLLAEFGLPERFVLYPANLWPHKNHERLLEAMSQLEDRELALVLTGQTYGRLERLAGRARQLGVERRVHHLGLVPADALAALYRTATALVFPSLYEGFGAPPVEAMGCGCPVAASDRGSLPEVCGEAALIFDAESPASVADAIGRVTADHGLRARLCEEGLQRAAHFNWRTAAEGHGSIYERAAETRAARPC
jgi:glycosyltransferase involved in cell wall biosynthesis